jgi:D-galactarolactone cycloisomerase
MNALAPFDVYWVEEPLEPEDLEGYRRLAGRTPLRFAAGEACVASPEFRDLAATGSVDVLMPDLNMCGGFVEGLRIADMALLSGLKVSPHVWGSAVGMAAALHFAAALPTSPHITRSVADPWVEHDVSDNPLARDTLTPPLPTDGGRMALPAGPGLGIELDEAEVRRLTLS